jgi:3-phosphoshikimate 1-carboxyvinyltransferase
MHFFEEILPQFGAKVKSQNGYIPIEIEGPMHGSEISLDGSLSSQYLSGLLMALPLLETESRLSVENLKSIPYVQMTLNTLTQFGIEIQHQNFEQFIIAGKQKYLPTNYIIEGDWSAASYWLVASALGQNIKISGLSLTSLQADKAILKAFETANCTIIFDENQISIEGNKRKSFQFDATHCPDLFPALATFAALCDGRSDIKGISRLKHKESDRGEVLKSEFEKLGVNIVLNEQDDTMHIYGKNSIEGGKVNSHNDHRIAMCLAIAGMFAEAEIEIDEAESVGKSYLNFWEDFTSAGSL